MICRNCGKELPDLAVYCPNCGTKRYGGAPAGHVSLELADPMNSRVIIERVVNQTSALSALKKLTGLELAEIRKILSDLPHEVRSCLRKDAAEELAAELRAAGMEARVSGPKEDSEITLRNSPEAE